MQQKIADIVEQLFTTQADVELSRPEPQFGDFATNVALKLAKPLGKNPRDIAELIAEKLRETGDFSEVNVAGPGFINVRLSNAALLATLNENPQQPLEGINYVVEYSCPNAFKELHTGHLYQTIVGDVVARLVEHAGASTNRTSFGGDVGLHVAKCVYGMVQTLGGEHLEELEKVENNPFARARWISQAYVTGAQAYEASPETKQQIDELNVQIYDFHKNDNHNSPLAQIYWTTRQWSFDYFAAFYQMLEVNQMRYIPESETMPIGMRVVEQELVTGNLEKSDGAVVFKGDESKNLHTRVFVTSKGLPTYETKDIGVIWLEKEAYDFDKRVLLTGNDQMEYMQVVFAAAETFRPELTGTMQHLTNGTVRFADGSKMSSRLGNVARAVDVIDAVRDQVSTMVDDPELREQVTLGAVKYAFCRYRLGGDIAFDIDETVSLAGNSGPYIQYAHARARSILNKSELTPALSNDYVLDEAERLLVRKLSEYADVIARATSEYAPHHICNYLFELAQEFNRFYEKTRVIGSENEAARLSLVQSYASTLKDSLGLLSIHAPEKI